MDFDSYLRDLAIYLFTYGLDPESVFRSSWKVLDLRLQCDWWFMNFDCAFCSCCSLIWGINQLSRRFLLRRSKDLYLLFSTFIHCFWGFCIFAIGYRKHLCTHVFWPFCCLIRKDPLTLREGVRFPRIKTLFCVNLEMPWTWAEGIHSPLSFFFSKEKY